MAFDLPLKRPSTKKLPKGPGRLPSGIHQVAPPPTPTTFEVGLQPQQTQPPSTQKYSFGRPLPNPPPAPGSMAERYDIKPGVPQSMLPGGVKGFGLGATQLVLGPAQFATEPLEVFGQNIAEIATLQAPSMITEGYSASLKKFEDRPMWQQLLIGILTDPIVVGKAASLATKASGNSLRGIVRAEIAKAVAKNTPDEVIDEATDALVRQNMKVRPKSNAEIVAWQQRSRREWEPKFLDTLHRRAGESKLRSGAVPPRTGLQDLVTKSDRLKMLEEFGLEDVAASNEFAGPLQPFSKILDGVVTSPSLVAQIAAKVGINPSVARNTPAGRTLTAYQTQLGNIEEQISTTVASVIDTHMQRVGPRGAVSTGRISHVLPIDKDGFFGRTGKMWQDVFEKPDAYERHLTPETRALIDDYNQTTNIEVQRILDDVGIDTHSRSRPTGEYYVPRDVKEIRGIETRRHSDSHLRRHYEEATEGFGEGIRYDIDPRETLSFYLRWAYKQAARKQFADALEPLSLTPKQVVDAHIVSRYGDAMLAKRATEQLRRSVRKGIVTAEANLRTAAEKVRGRRRPVSMMQKDLDDLDGIISTLGESPGVTESRLAVRATEQSVGRANTSLKRLNEGLKRVQGALGRATARAEDTRILRSTLAKEVDDLESIIDSIQVTPHMSMDQLDDAIRAHPETARWHQLTGRLQQAKRSRGNFARRVESAERSLTNREAIQERLELLRDDFTVRRDLARTDLNWAAKDLADSNRNRGRALRESGRHAGALKSAKERQKRLEGRERTGRKRIETAEVLEGRIQTRLSILRDTLEAIDAKMPTLRVEYTSSKNSYSRALDEAKKAEVGPGNLFGPNQPDEIAISNWKNRFFTRKDADMLEDALGEQGTPGVAARGLEILGNTIRTLSATADLAMPFIQGLPVLAENPKAWGVMLLRHHQALVDPTVHSRLIREHFEDFQWLARNGVPIGDPEFFAAIKPGEGVSADMLFKMMPKGDEARRFLRAGGKQTFGRFQASYNTGLGYSRVLLLRGLRDSWRGTDAELAQYIRNLTGGLDSRALGVAPRQRALEGVWLAFSPRLLRSTTALVWDALNPAASVMSGGRIQRTEVGMKSMRNIARLAMGASMIYTLTGLALGKDWDEISSGLNPLNGKKFLSHQINGDWIGVGGQVRAISQLMAGMTVGLITEPESLVTFDRYENPIIKYLSGRGAPGLEIIGGVVEAASGGSIDALPYDEVDGPIDLLKHTGTSMTPFVVQGAMEGEKPLTIALGGTGARTSPETVFEKRATARQAVMDREGIEGAYEDQDRDVRIQINEAPEVVEASKVVQEKQLEKKNNVTIYLKSVEEKREATKKSIAGAAEQFGPGEKFRTLLSENYRTLATRLASVDEEPRHQEAIEILDEMDPKTGLLDRATRAFYTRMDEAILENPNTGEYNYTKRDAILEALRRPPTEGIDLPGYTGGFGSDTIDKVLELNRRNEHPLETQLREDREVLRIYWNVRRDIAEVLPEGNARSLWLTYIDEDTTPTQKQALQMKYGKFISRVEGMVQKLRARLRYHPQLGEDINRALMRQEYNTTPQTIAGLEELVNTLQRATP